MLFARTCGRIRENICKSIFRRTLEWLLENRGCDTPCQWNFRIRTILWMGVLVTWQCSRVYFGQYDAFSLLKSFCDQRPCRFAGLPKKWHCNETPETLYFRDERAWNKRHKSDYRKWRHASGILWQVWLWKGRRGYIDGNENRIVLDDNRQKPLSGGREWYGSAYKQNKTNVF